MVTPEFNFEAVLAYRRKRFTQREVDGLLEFIKNFTVEINDVDLSNIKYGGTILN